MSELVANHPGELAECLLAKLMMAHAKMNLSGGDVIILSKTDMQASKLQDLWDHAVGIDNRTLSLQTEAEFGEALCGVLPDATMDAGPWKWMVHHSPASIFRVVSACSKTRRLGTSTSVHDHISVIPYVVVLSAQRRQDFSCSAGTG